MLFSILIPTLGRKAELERFLGSLDGQRAGYEAIVMDQNGAGFGLAEVCSCYPNVRHVASAIKGLSVNRNKAIALASGDWFLFADDDCVLGEGFLENAARTLVNESGRAVIYFAEVRNLEDGGFYTFPLTEKDSRIGYANFKKIPSIGFLFSKRAIQDLSGFDERMGVGAAFGSGEDTDILLRALARGIPVLRLPGCAVFHPRMAAKPSLERCRNYALGYGALFAKHLVIQPWRRKPIILAAWVAVLVRNLGGVVLNIGRPSRFIYYLNSLIYKARGHARFLALHASGSEL